MDESQGTLAQMAIVVSWPV